MTGSFRSFFLAAAIAFLSAHPSATADGGKSAFQIGVLTALMDGVFEGDATFADLKKQGDMGIGTFNGLDGEMAAVDGVFYRIRFDGTATPADDGDKTPFATVASFSPDREIALGPVEGFNALCARLDKELPTENIVYAVRIDGLFAHIKARSVPGYQRPYPKLPEIVKTQSHLPYDNVEGTLVGFRFPDYAKGVNVPGWHLHFLTKDRKRGGHVLDVKFEKATAGLVFLNGFSVELQKGGQLHGARLGSGAETKGVFTEK
ncbi:MAG: acetolactate decarboxylase [Nitrospinae bacterium]|nr:acetolactate decarboxylase [Nitrospinota bacterium]MBF0633962.1 acetolactate decarboxylase [Nitrospinota bacterium]